MHRTSWSLVWFVMVGVLVGAQACQCGGAIVCQRDDQCPTNTFCDTITSRCLDTSQGECQSGERRDCYSGPVETAGKGLCRAGSQWCNTQHKWGPCQDAIVPTTEICNDGKDNDCDGQIDNGCQKDICSQLKQTPFRITGAGLPTGLHRVLYTIEIIENFPRITFSKAPAVEFSRKGWGIEKITFDPKQPEKLVVQVGFFDDWNKTAILTLTGELTIHGSGVPVIGTCPFQHKAELSSCISQEFCGDGIDDDCDGQIDEAGCLTNCPTTGHLRCGQECIDPNTDHRHCGACDNACSGGLCKAGNCTPP